MKDQDFQSIIALGYERGGIEFKGPGGADAPGFLARIARAVLGLSNRRDGGLVVIGVKEGGGQPLDVVGLEPKELASWQRPDDVHAAINAFADPSAVFELDFEPSSRRCVVI